MFPLKRKALPTEAEDLKTKVLKTERNAGFSAHRPVGKLQNIRSQIPEGMKLSRKNLRKEMRQMKKCRRNAYSSKQPVIYNVHLIIVIVEKDR